MTEILSEHLDRIYSSEVVETEIDGYQAGTPEDFHIEGVRSGLIIPENAGEIFLARPADHLSDYPDSFGDLTVDALYGAEAVNSVIQSRLVLIAERFPDEPLFRTPRIFINEHIASDEFDRMITKLQQSFPLLQEGMATVMYAQMIRAFQIEEILETQQPMRIEMPVVAAIFDEFARMRESGLHASRDHELGDYTAHAERLAIGKQLAINRMWGRGGNGLDGDTLVTGQIPCDMCTPLVRNGKFAMVAFGSVNNVLGVGSRYQSKGNGKLTLLPVLRMNAGGGFSEQNPPVVIDMGMNGLHAAAHIGLGVRNPDTERMEPSTDPEVACRPEYRDEDEEVITDLSPKSAFEVIRRRPDDLIG